MEGVNKFSRFIFFNEDALPFSKVYTVGRSRRADIMILIRNGGIMWLVFFSNFLIVIFFSFWMYL